MSIISSEGLKFIKMAICHETYQDHSSKFLAILVSGKEMNKNE